MNIPQDNPTEVAWLAGLFDGEGSFAISTYNNTKQRRAGIGNVRAVIQMTHLETLQRAHSIVKGITGIGHLHALRVRSRYKPAWQLIINGARGTKLLLQAIEPYSVTKQTDIMIMKQACSLFASKGGQPGNRRNPNRESLAVLRKQLMDGHGYHWHVSPRTTTN